MANGKAVPTPLSAYPHPPLPDPPLANRGADRALFGMSDEQLNQLAPWNPGAARELERRKAITGKLPSPVGDVTQWGKDLWEKMNTMSVERLRTLSDDELKKLSAEGITTATTVLKERYSSQAGDTTPPMPVGKETFGSNLPNPTNPLPEIGATPPATPEPWWGSSKRGAPPPPNFGNVWNGEEGNLPLPPSLPPPAPPAAMPGGPLAGGSPEAVPGALPMWAAPAYRGPENPPSSAPVPPPLPAPPAGPPPAPQAQPGDFSGAMTMAGPRAVPRPTPPPIAPDSFGAGFMVPPAPPTPPPATGLEAFRNDPDKMANLRDFGLRLMMAGEARPGSQIGPTLLGSVGAAGMGTVQDVRARKAASATAATEQARHKDKMALGERKIKSNEELRKETMRLRAESDRLANQIAATRARTSQDANLIKIDEMEAEQIADINKDMTLGVDSDDPVKFKQDLIEDAQRNADILRRRFGGEPRHNLGSKGGNMEGRTATNPDTGEKLIFRKGQWVPI